MPINYLFKDYYLFLYSVPSGLASAPFMVVDKKTYHANLSLFLTWGPQFAFVIGRNTTQYQMPVVYRLYVIYRHGRNFRDAQRHLEKNLHKYRPALEFAIRPFEMTEPTYTYRSNNFTVEFLTKQIDDKLFIYEPSIKINRWFLERLIE